MAAVPNPLEEAVVKAFPWLLAGLAASLPLLLVPQSDDPTTAALIHLSGLVVYGLALTIHLSPLSDGDWFPGREWSPARRRLVAAVSLVVIVTGVVGLVTLASSAAMWYQPSLQFLQLLSALDIAWVVGGTMLAVRWLWGRPAAVVAGVMMGIVCVMSIALYLDEVGLSADGGWLVDRDQMLRLVLPFDVAAAIITIGLIAVAAQQASPDRAGQPPVV